MIGLMRESRAGRSAVLAPGGGYGPDKPLLMFARYAVERRGGQAHAVTWQLPKDDDGQLHERVAAQVAAVVDEVTAATGSAPVVIGKSLGSMAAPLVADRGLPAVWLTPLLTDKKTLAGLRRATAPCLRVGGTGDQDWDGEAARSISADVVEIDGADHGMLLPGPLAASASALGQVTTAVEAFLDRLWP